MPDDVWCLFYMKDGHAELSMIFTTREAAEKTAADHPKALPEAFVQAWAVHP